MLKPYPLVGQSSGYQRATRTHLCSSSASPVYVRGRCIVGGLSTSICPVYFQCQIQSHCRASSSDDQSFNPAPGKNTSLLEAADAVQKLINTLSAGLADEMLEWAPDEAIDALLEARKKTGEAATSVSFKDVAEFVAGQETTSSSSVHPSKTDSDSDIKPGGSLGLVMDSIAHRHMVWSKPKHIVPLSAISLGPDRSIHRLLVESCSGEEVTLTLSLEREDSLHGTYRGAPRILPAWRLRSAVGEPAAEFADELPKAPSPAVGPELVVQAQLAALQRQDFAGVFAFASPDNKALAGPLDNFAKTLKAPRYSPLLRYSSVDSLKCCMYSEDAYYEVVCVQYPPDPSAIAAATAAGAEPQYGVLQKAVYLWDVHRQGPGQEHAGAWMTQSVQVISGATVMRWPF